MLHILEESSPAGREHGTAVVVRDPRNSVSKEIVVFSDGDLGAENGPGHAVQTRVEPASHLEYAGGRSRLCHRPPGKGL